MNGSIRAFAVIVASFFAASMMAQAQFKVVGPAPYPPTVARQKIKTLLEAVDPGNSQKTIETLSGLLSWYRDILDEELIAAWQKDTRANLPGAIEALADSRVASAVVEFSWREQRPAAFQLAYAPMFGNLMARFPESAQPFLDDLRGPAATGRPMPDLPQPQAEAVCRILLDMPDVGTWRKDALQILPHYRRSAETLLAQDLHGSDQEKTYAAQQWLNELKADGPANGQPSSRRRLTHSPSSADGTPPGDQAPPAAAPRNNSVQLSAPAAANPAPVRAPLPSSQVPSSQVPSAAPLPYNGARSGTLECGGHPVPQNAEYVFRDLPAGKMQLDYDTKTWDALLAPGDGQTQRLILRNKNSGPQKKCVVHWSVIP